MSSMLLVLSVYQVPVLSPATTTVSHAKKVHTAYHTGVVVVGHLDSMQEISKIILYLSPGNIPDLQ